MKSSCFTISRTRPNPISPENYDTASMPYERVN
jgi:hypothetical protein